MRKKITAVLAVMASLFGLLGASASGYSWADSWSTDADNINKITTYSVQVEGNNYYYYPDYYGGSCDGPVFTSGIIYLHDPNVDEYIHMGTRYNCNTTRDFYVGLVYDGVEFTPCSQAIGGSDYGAHVWEAVKDTSYYWKVYRDSNLFCTLNTNYTSVKGESVEAGTYTFNHEGALFPVTLSATGAGVLQDMKMHIDYSSTWTKPSSSFLVKQWGDNDFTPIIYGRKFVAGTNIGHCARVGGSWSDTWPSGCSSPTEPTP